MVNLLKEAQDLEVYKKLVKVLGEYSDSFPATGAGKWYRELLKVGLKAMPKDKLALRILDKILSCKHDSVPARVTKLINYRFSDLPFHHQPIYKDGRAKQVAFWSRNGKSYDRVIAMLNTGEDKDRGMWATMDGTGVDLVDMTISKSDKDLKESLAFDKIDKVLYTDGFDGFWVSNESGEKEFVGQHPQVRQIIPESVWDKAVNNPGVWISIKQNKEVVKC